MGNARLDRKLTTLLALPDHGDFTSDGDSYEPRRRCLAPAETPASRRVMRHNGLMEPDHAARAYGYESFADWSAAVAAEMRWGVFDPSRVHQLTDLFAEARLPVTTEGAALLRAWEVATPPNGDLDPLYTGGWIAGDGFHLTAAATRLRYDSLDAIAEASR